MPVTVLSRPNSTAHPPRCRRRLAFSSSPCSLPPPALLTPCSARFPSCPLLASSSPSFLFFLHEVRVATASRPSQTLSPSICPLRASCFPPYFFPDQRQLASQWPGGTQRVDLALQRVPSSILMIIRYRIFTLAISQQRRAVCLRFQHENGSSGHEMSTLDSRPVPPLLFARASEFDRGAD